MGMIRSYIQLIFMSPCVHLQEKQQQEEEELRRQEREAKLFASLGAQGVPTFGAEVRLFCCSQCKYAWLVTIDGFYYLYWYTQAPTDGLQLVVPKFESLSILIICKSAKDAYMIVIWEGGRQMHSILKDELNNLLLTLNVTCFANNSATKWIMHPDETMCLQVHASVAQIDFPVYCDMLHYWLQSASRI